ncbi:LamG-like jellyroll fold domain-containing protein [Cognataquiflexum rubidum]|uniref:LamG-like jellyroll fold domain-containing protein n=1 Tax=Cognataquiflexum rubidum TaxID=2922273 RepID=UPI001F13578D|nr:LamG-like jellyroll fold domain-containing protein [Cognataquiflexum rubidum]MCH6236486.1 T9SS type A sorting domain-containing protein [Cognataquiflexum rubidum]
MTILSQRLTIILFFFLFQSYLFSTSAFSQSYPPSDFDPQINKTVAFPGAEGFGKFASGGRGGQILKVTNLNDSGPGSLREAIDMRGPRIIVFEVSGTISLRSDLIVRSGDLTIAGQTAPGDGITLRNYPFVIKDADNIIVRFIRSRLGDTSGVDGDAIEVNRVKNLIIDHCSFSWGIDETCSIYSGENATLQNSIISEGLNKSTVHLTGDHAFGSLLGGKNFSMFNNLMAHFVLRVPSITTGSETFDLRNNVIYNWEKRPSNNAVSAKANFYNNYFKPGPATKARPSNELADQNFFWATSSNGDPNTYGKFYLEGNVVVGRSLINTNQWSGVRLETSDLTTKYLERLKNKNQNGDLVPFPIPEGLYSKTRSADAAFDFVLDFVGASLSRDAVDTRIVQETRNGNFTHKGSRTGLLGIIDSQSNVGGWPSLKTLPAPTDTDGDGMPDAWESAQGLNPSTADDKGFDLSPYYTNIEIYINSLVQELLFLQNPGVPSAVKPLLPATNETVSPVQISFVWEPLLNASKYSLQISKSSSFSSGVITISNTTTTSLVYPELDANSSYFWRVRGSNSSGNGNYSPTQSFKTNSKSIAPGKTLLLSPNTQEQDISLSPLMKWANVPNANTYQIQISTSSSFSTVLLNQGGINATEYQSPKLSENTTYYWRVRASNSSGTGSYSNIGTFNTLSKSTPPQAVVAVSPLNKVNISPTNIKFIWLEEFKSDSYDIQIAKDYNFTNVILSKYSVVGESFGISSLESNTTYYWRVRGKNRSGVGKYSGINQFSTNPFPNAPQKPQAISPEDGANVFDTKITFTWQNDAIAQSYRLQVSNSSSFSSLITNVSNLSNNSTTVSNLPSNTLFYWRVIASNEAGNSPASETRKVRTASYSGIPGPASLISPTNLAVVGSSSILFEWENQPNTGFYRLDISEQSNFSNLAFSKSSITGTSLIVDGLEANKTYFWRVRTSNPSGSGPYSDIRSFSTVNGNINLSPPPLLLPQKASNFQNTGIGFSWGSVTNADAYHLQVSTSPDFATVTFQNQTIANTTFNLSTLTSGNAYYWRVRAIDGTVLSAWSEIWNFSIGSTETLITSGLVGHWAMEENGGNKMLDGSGNTNHATIQNTSNASWVSGKSGRAISLNGWSGGFGNAPHHSSLGMSSSLTLAAWVKPKELQRGHIFYKSAGKGYELWLDIDGYIEFRLNRTNNGTTYRIRSKTQYSGLIGKWIHVAATFNGSTIRLYINGKEDSSSNYAPFTINTTSGNLVIGAMGTNQRWKGELDELRIYDRSLSGNEILLLMDETPLSNPSLQSTELRGYWKMDEGLGSQFLDGSGNNNHATILNSSAVTWSDGKINLGVNLNGWSGRYAIAPHQPSLEIKDAMTISVWIRPSSLHRGTIVSKAAGNGFELWLDNEGSIEFRLNRGSSGTAYRIRTPYKYTGDIGKWVHLTATFDGQTSKVYVNGSENISTTYLNPFQIGTTSGDLIIGAMGSIQRFTGSMDDLRIYNSALTLAEIQNLMLASNAMRLGNLDSEKHLKPGIENNFTEDKLIQTPENEAGILELVLYPNPATDQINVSNLWVEKGDVQINILDPQGRMVIEKTVYVEDYKIIIDLPSNSMTMGAYIIIIQDNINRKILKFIKQ